MKAWKVTHKEFPGTVIIHKAENRHQARYKSVCNAQDVGYEMVSYTEATAIRAPEFDELPDPAHFFESLGWAESGGESWGCLYNERN